MNKKIAILAVVSALALTGCSTSQNAVTVGNASDATATAAAVETGAQKVLTAEQIQQALPTVDQLGPEWGPAPESTSDTSSSSSQATFTPAECEFQASLGGSTLTSVVGAGDTEVATGKVAYSLTSDGAFAAHQTSVTITSYKDTVSSSGIDALASRLKKCETFTATDGATGVTTSAQILPLSLPNYGDKTLAFRLQASVGAFTVIVDVVQILIGHNVVSIAQSGLGGVTPDLTGAVADATMKNLNEATK